LFNWTGIACIDVMLDQRTETQIRRECGERFLVVQKKTLQANSGLIWKINLVQSFDEQSVYMARKVKIRFSWTWVNNLKLGFLVRFILDRFIL